MKRSVKGRAGALHLFEDVGGLGGPDQRLGGFVVMVNILDGGFDEFFDVAEDAVAQPVLYGTDKQSYREIGLIKLTRTHRAFTAVLLPWAAVHC